MSKLVSVLLGVAVVAAGLQIPSAAQAATIIGSSSLLTPSYLTQLESWLINDPTLAYDGSLVLTEVWERTAGATGSNFRDAVVGIGPTIFVAEVNAFVNGSRVSALLGGFNPQSYTDTVGYTQTAAINDRTAFIFNLTTGDRRDQATGTSGPASSGQYQTYNTDSYGPTFGNGYDIYIGNGFSGSLNASSYCPPALLALGCTAGPNLLGGLNTTAVTWGALEVFTISTTPLAAVPVPAAMPMLAAGLGALGLLGWRKRSRARLAA